MADHLMAVPQGTFDLLRHPERDRQELRAWDAADELLLERLAELGAPSGAPLVMDDAYGALSVPLAHLEPTLVVDSWCSGAAVRENLVRNGSAERAVEVRTPLDEPPDQVSLLIVRPPRNLALLEHLLRWAKPALAKGAVVIGAEMVKHLHTSTLEVFERVIGPTTTSLARRRARTLECRPDPTLDPGPWPWPATTTLQPGAIRVTSWPGVFAAGRLDRGTALLLEHLPETDGPESVVDLGCGNGVLGTVAGMDNPEAEVTFVDDSALALASARRTWVDNVGRDRAAGFAHGNGLLDPPALPERSAGLVLCNPPFHEHRAMGDAVAWQMFTDADRVLRSGGELWVVGNRHLAYHAKLRRIFGNCEVVASSAKFVVLRAVRR